MIFDDLFHNKLPVLVILVPVMISPLESGRFLGKFGFRGSSGSEGAEAAEVNEAGEASKAWKITTVD